MTSSPDSAERTTHWDGIYDRVAEDELSWFQSSPDCSVDLLDELGVVPANSLVDVGAGASRLVDVLLRRGFRDLTVLDVSDAGLAQTRNRLGADAQLVTWVVADLLNWVPGRRFDVWHDRAVLHFVTDPHGIENYRRVLSTAIRPGGAMIVGTFAADGPTHCSGLPVTRYSPDQLARVFENTLEVVATRREEHHTPSGGMQPFTWVAFRARARERSG